MATTRYTGIPRRSCATNAHDSNNRLRSTAIGSTWYLFMCFPALRCPALPCPAHMKIRTHCEKNTTDPQSGGLHFSNFSYHHVPPKLYLLSYYRTYSDVGVDGVDGAVCADSGGVVLSYQTTLGADTMRYTVHSAFQRS